MPAIAGNATILHLFAKVFLTPLFAPHAQKQADKW
jgi:hypothetical protein